MFMNFYFIFWCKFIFSDLLKITTERERENIETACDINLSSEMNLNGIYIHRKYIIQSLCDNSLELSANYTHSFIWSINIQNISAPTKIE